MKSTEIREKFRELAHQIDTIESIQREMLMHLSHPPKFSVGQVVSGRVVLRRQLCAQYIGKIGERDSWLYTVLLLNTDHKENVFEDELLKEHNNQPQ